MSYPRDTNTGCKQSRPSTHSQTPGLAEVERLQDEPVILPKNQQGFRGLS